MFDTLENYWWIAALGLVALAWKAGWIEQLLSDPNNAAQGSASPQPISPQVEDALTNKNKPKKKPEPRSVDTTGIQHFRSEPSGGSPVQAGPTMSVVGVDPREDSPPPGSERYRVMMREKYEAEMGDQWHRNR